MKITVAQYASSRNISEATVKKAISDKQWDLEHNPNDKRQRLLSLQQQAELDQSIPKASPPSATPVVTAEVVPYQRPTEVGMILAERAVTVGEIVYQPQSATDNPLYQALEAKLRSMQAQNLQASQQMQANAAANRDTAAAIDGLKQMQIIQDAEAQAYRDFQLKKQAHAAAMQRLELQDAGLTPAPSPAAPPVAPSPTTPPMQPPPVEYSKSPF